MPKPTADELLALALRVSSEARAKKRAAFDRKWGLFWKCPACGRRYASLIERNFPPEHDDCGVDAVRVGYSMPQVRR